MLYESIYMKSQNRQFHRDRMEMVMGFYLGVTGMWNSGEVVVAQKCECPKCH